MATTTRKAQSRRQARQEARQERRGGRQEARQERRSGRQKARQTTGRRARVAGRQERRGERRQERIGARTTRAEARAARRASVVQSKAEGGAYSPESVAARWAGIEGTTEAVGGLAGTIAGAVSGTGAAGGALDALSGLAPEDAWLDSDEDYYADVVDLYPEEDAGMDWLIPVAIGGAVLGAFLLFGGDKKKK